MNTTDTERSKYEKMWAGETSFNYRRVSPAERAVGKFLADMKPEKFSTIVDLGCGTGRAALELYDKGYTPICVDIAENCLDPQVAEKIPLVQCSLWEVDATLEALTTCDHPSPAMRAKPEYGFCVDVLEHLPTDKVSDTLAAIRRAVAVGVWFQPATFPHVIEDLVLHLTVREWQWWLAQFEEHWPHVEQTGPDDQRPQFTCMA